MYNEAAITARRALRTARQGRDEKMKMLAILCMLACVALLSGCRHGSLAKSVAKNQYRTVQGVLYSDSLITDDGRSRLTGSIE